MTPTQIAYEVELAQKYLADDRLSPAIRKAQASVMRKFVLPQIRQLVKELESAT